MRRRPTHRSCLFLGVLLTPLLLSVDASAVERGVDVDLTWGIPGADVAPTQSAITDVGAKWVRLTMHWRDAEPSNDSYSNQTLTEWDSAVAAAETTGAKIIAVVGRSPSWASGSNDQYMPPLDPADYADFMRFIVSRYQGKVAAWEIWNEQNTLRFWPTGPNAAEYVQLLQAAYPAVKAADPAALVAFGGLAYSDYSYVSQAYAAGAKGYFDVMVTHPYSDSNSPDFVSYYKPGVPHKESFTAYREVRNRMLANGDDKPIWFTEFGWSTCTTNGKCVSESQQAAYLTRAFCIMEQDPYVQVALWYNLRNNHWNDDADAWETQLGLLNTTFVPKPAYSAFKNYDPSACPSSEPPGQTEPQPESETPTPTALPEPDSELAGVSPQPTAPLDLRSPQLAVRRAQIDSGRLLVDARVSRAAPGGVWVSVSFGDESRRFAVPVGPRGTITVRRRLRAGSPVSRALVTLVYPGNSAFHHQWVILHAAERAARMRVRPTATVTTTESGYAVHGTLAPDARGSVVCVVSYRTRSGRTRTRVTRAQIQEGMFDASFAVPDNARAATLNIVFLGNPNRGIGGSSTTRVLR
jgi:hypothetical protein